MTDPVQATTVRMGAYTTARKYSWPPQPPHEFTVSSVTSIIKNGLPKPHLVGWAAKKTAECAIADHDIIAAMLAKPKGKAAAISHVKGSRYRDMDEKADRGNIVHAAVDAYLSGKPYTREQLSSLMDEYQTPQYMVQSTVGMIAGAMEFLWEAEPDVHHNEATLYSRQHEYAGTADMVCTMHIGKSRVPVIVDFKTSKSIYDEVALQLVAYARADFVGHNDGSEGIIIPSGDPIRHGVVIRPKADGTYERADFTLNDTVFDMFLGCKKVSDGVETSALAAARRPTVQ